VERLRIGIDVGGTKIEAVALAGGREHARIRVETPRDDYAATLAAIAALVDELERKAGTTGTVGVGIPGTISAATGLVKNANSTWLIGRPLQRDLELRLGRHLRLANDANCFAVSEAIDGAALGADVVFGVIVGTGTGAGVVIRGHVLTGANGIAGEWGHNALPWPTDDELPGPQCYCEKSGCIETFLSGPGMSADHERHTGRREPAPAIAAAADRGDMDAVATLERYEHRMGRALASVINVLDPDVIVLGGGMSNIERLYSGVPRVWGRYVFAATQPAANDQIPTVNSRSRRLDSPHPSPSAGRSTPHLTDGSSAGGSSDIRTRLVRAKHGDTSGVRGAAWLWADE
jgi:fructokinase